MDGAACAPIPAAGGTDGRAYLTAMFYPDPDAPETERRRLIAQAKRLCAVCPIQPRCLTIALTHPECHGIWGGTTEEERREMFP